MLHSTHYQDKIHELGHARLFSKADVASAYWHVKLDDESSHLTTFQTCHGRYRWLRLPFGISVSAEIFQRKLFEALKGLHGIICIVDDVIIYGKDEEARSPRNSVSLSNVVQKKASD